MRKKVIIVVAAILLATAGAPRAAVPVGMNKVYESEPISNPEQEFESEPELEFEPELESELESVPELELELESESESEPEPESELESELESEPEESIIGIVTAEGESGVIGEDTISEAQEEQFEAKTVKLETDEGAESEIEEASSETEEYGIEERVLGFAVLSQSEAVVKNYAELKSALADDNGITTVYFGDNITMQGGIKINPKKADVVIVGLNPLDSGRTQPYTLTDLDSATFVDTVYVSEAGTRTLHVRDLTMIGKNYYGPFSVADIIGLDGFVTTYERVSYNGPQLCHNRRGTARLIDSSVSIHGGNGVVSPHQEFSEAKRLVFEGVNKIDNATSAYSIFWHPLGGSFEIADDSSLVITSPNTSAVFGVFYADGYLNRLDITVGSRSVLDMTISGVVAPEANVTVNSLMVHEGGAFHLKTTQTAAATVLRVGGELVVGKDAAFTINGAGGAAQSVLRQQGGDIAVEKDATFEIIAANPYASLLNLAGSELICGDPASVLLYNAGRDIVASTNAGRVYVNAQQINYWKATVPDGFDFPPLYGWRKADQSNFVIDGTLAAGSDANFSKVISNYAAGDPPGLPPDASTFNMANSRVLAFGRLEIVAAEPAVKSVSVEGVTAAGALVRVSFTQGGVDYMLPDVMAGYDGGFHIPTGVALEAGTVIKIKSRWRYLTAETEVTVQEQGSLELYAPEVLEFYTMPMSPFKETVKRLNPNWKIVVSDTRGTGGKWCVYAKLDHEMIPQLQHRPTLEGALIFVDDSGKISVLNTDTDILILKHTRISGEDVQPIVWDEDKGVLLDIRPGTAFADTRYTASICWTVVDGV